MPISYYILCSFTFYLLVLHKYWPQSSIIIVIVFCPHSKHNPFYLLSYYLWPQVLMVVVVVVWYNRKILGPWKFKVTAAAVFGIPTSFTKASGWEGWAFGHWHSNNTTHHIYFQKQQVNLPCRRTLAQSCQKHWGPYIKLSESCMCEKQLSDNFSICA